MSLENQYRELFDKEIVQKSKGIIFSFCPIKNKYQFNPYAHAVSESAVEDLATLMRHNLLFYAFGEEEVVRLYQEDLFESLENAAKYAYKQRLPKRADITDGLPSEALLDLLIQIYNPNAYKLAVRTILRQDDNNEIKGYDLSYFTKDQTGVSLWLGQAKLGGKDYCKSSISKDLLSKYTKEYLAKQIYFICDKRIEITDDAKEILAAINRINAIMIDKDDSRRIDALIEHFQKSNIKIRIPCLLAYGENSVYFDAKDIFDKIQIEVESIRQYYAKQAYSFEQIAPEIIFYIFPIESVERLRDKERGFYAGLC
ncbi:Hachiman antiphage defense system protein HamA [Gemmiger sp. An194]|uniref:Hachiman antiphage defense system protein HamA n=1 Tax=Gemmiger sp. An194 TaxID=1965582 RepID=UPI000B377B29|nr:Hachiman antiphage defense system protein HamA [Gemmiger sp. An194]OUP23425.1 hypothetical protein B5F28_11415 [Gemmiger sp. An194]